MLKIIRHFIFPILLAQWVYSEITLAFPQLKPALDVTIASIRIPTHDKWDEIATMFQEHRVHFVEVVEAQSGAVEDLRPGGEPAL